MDENEKETDVKQPATCEPGAPKTGPSTVQEWKGTLQCELKFFYRHII